jgi:hypothetical protein
MSAHSCNIFLYFSVSYINDPLTSHVTKLNKTVKDDVNTFSQIIIDRSEVQWAFYLSQYVYHVDNSVFKRHLPYIFAN